MRASPMTKHDLGDPLKPDAAGTHPEPEGCQPDKREWSEASDELRAADRSIRVPSHEDGDGDDESEDPNESCPKKKLVGSRHADPNFASNITERLGGDRILPLCNSENHRIDLSNPATPRVGDLAGLPGVATCRISPSHLVTIDEALCKGSFLSNNVLLLDKPRASAFRANG